MRIVAIGVLLAASSGCGDSSSGEGGGAQGGSGTGGAAPLACVSIETLGQSSVYEALGPFDDYLADVDQDGDVDLLLVNPSNLMNELVLQRAFNEGSSLAVEAPTMFPDTDHAFLHPSQPNILVSFDQSGETAFINVADLTEDRAQCAPHAFVALFVPALPIDVDGDGSADIFGREQNDAVSIVSMSDTDPCGTVVSATDLTSLPILQTPEDYGSNEVWADPGAGVVRLTDGQGLSGGIAVATSVSADGSMPGYESTLGDVDGDGDHEMVGNDGTDLVVVEIAQATWSETTFYGIPQEVRITPQRVGDLDCDGDLDVWDKTGLWINQGDGSFTPGPLFPGLLIGITDATGDGVPDYITKDVAGVAVTAGIAVTGS